MLLFLYVNSPINVLPHYPALGYIWGFQTAESTDPCGNSFMSILPVNTLIGALEILKFSSPLYYVVMILCDVV